MADNKPANLIQLQHLQAIHSGAKTSLDIDQEISIEETKTKHQNGKIEEKTTTQSKIRIRSGSPRASPKEQNLKPPN